MTYEQIAEKIESLRDKRDKLINNGAREDDVRAIELQDRIERIKRYAFNKRQDENRARELPVIYQEVLPV